MVSIRHKTAMAVFCAVLLGCTSVNAATVSKQSGAVLINTGSGFSPILSEAELAPGHQIMVPPGGLASITYANNCVVRVGSGIWLVQAAPPCANGATEIDFTTRMNQATDPTPPPGIPPLLVVGGAVGAVAIIVTLILNKDKSASP
mgnify:CR=1 FL=1